MNFFAYRTTGLAVKILTAFSKARITLHNEKELPQGGTIFVINHFTRLETLLLPYHISKLLDKPVWSLASSELFGGLMGRYLEQVGAVSVGDPERDKLIIKSLVGEGAAWIVFPEGCMVKNRKVVDRGSFMITADGDKYPPRTGAAALAWRAEILRRRLGELNDYDPEGDNQNSFTVLSGVSNGTLTRFNATTGEFTYTPNAGYIGNERFTYNVLVDGKLSNSALITVRVDESLVTEQYMKSSSSGYTSGLLLLGIVGLFLRRRKFNNNK